MTPLDNHKIQSEWLEDKTLQSLFDALSAEGEETRINGGAVRNALMGEPVSDIDLSTTLLPTEVVARAEASGFKAVPTGIEHGTVTVVAGERTFEVTTLREDVETDGRHAVVKFGKDWLADASRRDLTINALYCDREGQVFDPLDGIKDIEKREVRFIGDASARIQEDALRILRFFRFFAFYGSGRPDASGLKACAANKELVKTLSAERVWKELKQILSATDPGRVLLWMRTTGVLVVVLPETEKWGIDHIPALVRLEEKQGWAPDPLLRLMTIMRPHIETVRPLAKRLSLSNDELERLEMWADSTPVQPDTDKHEFAKILYYGSEQGIVDRLKSEATHFETNSEYQKLDQLLSLIEFSEEWHRPTMPVQGRDLIEEGFSPGPELGALLKKLEETWVESGFSASKEVLLETIDPN